MERSGTSLRSREDSGHAIDGRRRHPFRQPVSHRGRFIGPRRSLRMTAVIGKACAKCQPPDGSRTSSPSWIVLDGVTRMSTASVSRQPASASAIRLSMIDLDAMAAAPLNRDPFDYFVVPEFLKPAALAAAIADYPDISSPGNHEPDAGCYGPAFGVLLDELRSPALEARVGAKFGVDLSESRLSITIRRHCESTDGHVHTDHRTKIVTLLVYLNEGWSADGGRLRFLRSTDLEDYAASNAVARGDAQEPRTSRCLRSHGALVAAATAVRPRVILLSAQRGGDE